MGYNGIEEIKNHPWLLNTNWRDIYLHKVKSVFVPELNKKIFNSFYFNDKKIENEDSKITLERYQITEMNKDYNNNKFDEFYYFNKYSMKYNKENKKSKFVNPHKKYEEEEKKEYLTHNVNINNKYEKKKNFFNKKERYKYFSNKIK